MIRKPLRMRWIGTLTCVVVATLLVSACATDAQRTQAQGAGAGALLGALIGVAVGHDARAALIGGAVGTAAGFGVGNHVANKKAQYAQREDALRASATRAQQLAQRTRQQNEQLSGEVARLDRTVENLRTQEMSAETRRALMEGSRRRASILLSGVDLQLQQVTDEIARQQAVLEAEARQAEQTKQASPEEGVRLVQAGIRDLQSNQRVLEEAKAQLQLIDPSRSY